MLYFISAWVVMAILSTGYWTDPDTPWYKHVLVIVTTPFWFGIACSILLHELGNRLYFYDE